jgi:hypothetical protein
MAPAASALREVTTALREAARRREITQPNDGKLNFHRELGFHVDGLLPFIPRDYSYQLE